MLHSLAILNKIRISVLSLITILFLFFPLNTNAISTITTESGTGFDGGNGVAGNAAITFVIDNTGPDPVMLTGIDVYWRNANDGTAPTLWYTSTDMSGQPNITTPSWDIITSANLPLSIPSSDYYKTFENLTFIIPPFTTYRFAVESTNGIRYSSTSFISPNNFSDGNINLYVHDYQLYSSNVGYGGPFPNPQYNPRAFTGRIHFETGNCTDPPYAGNVVASNSLVCPGSNFTVELDSTTPGLIGQSFQWQSSPTGNPGTWTNMPDTTRTLSTSQISTNWYRVYITCGNNTDTSGSVKVETQNLLNGHYTIDSSKPTSDTNFTSIFAAVDAMNLCGVNGPVTLNLAPGNYNEQILLTEVSGASSTNTITFEGGHRDSVNIEFAPTDYIERYVFRFDGAKYFHLTNLTINVNGGTWGWAIHLNNDANHNTISNCRILTDSTSTHQHAHAGIVASALNTNTTSNSNTANNLLIENNTISGGYSNISLNGSLSNRLSGIEINDNVLTSARDRGIYLDHLNSPEIKGNIIIGRYSNATNSATAITLQSVISGFEVAANRIYNFSLRGIFVTGSSGSSFNQNYIYNNMIGGGFANSFFENAGIVLSGSHNTNVYYNNINIDVNEGSAIYVQGGNSINVVNNSLVQSSGNDGFAIRVLNTNSMSNFDHNNFYSNGNEFIEYDGTQYSDLSSFQSATGTNANSISGDPVYTDINDLTINSSLMVGAGTPLSNFTVDYFGNNRDTVNPVIGAHEFDPVNVDIGVIDIQLDTDLICVNDTIEVLATVRNFGTDTITYANLNWSLNGVPQANTSFSDTLLPTSDIVLTIGAFSPDTSQIHEITAYTSDPNNITDENHSNDTTTALFESGIETYTYTIDILGADFQSITEAVNYLEKGICGPVTFEINPGSYEERVIIPPVKGASDINTVTIDGIDPDSVTVWYDNELSINRHVFRIEGARHINLKNMTINSEIGNRGWGIYLKDSSRNINISGNVILTDSSAINGYAGIVASGSGIYADRDITGLKDIKIENNIIGGGNFGIIINGDAGGYTENIVIQNNTIGMYYENGIHIQYAVSPIIKHNTISGRNVMETFASSVRMNYIDNGFELAYNYVFDSGLNGFRINNASGIASAPALIFNNIFNEGFTSNISNGAGITIGSSEYIDVLYNTIIYDLQGGRAISTGFASNNLNIKNNILYYKGGGSGYLVLIQDSTAINDFDYNLLYTNSSNFLRFGIDFNDLNDLQSNTSTSANSLYGQPGFVTIDGMPRVTNTALRNGKPVSGINDDYFGSPRDGIDPTIGAEEMLDNDDIGAVSIISPANETCADSSVSVEIAIQNFGLNVQSGFDIDVDVMLNDTLIQKLQTTYSGTLWVLDRDTVKVGNAFINSSGQYSFKAYTSLQGDDNLNNDTTLEYVNLSVPAHSPVVADKYACEASSFELVATHVNPGKSVSWYASPARESVIHVGDTFNTPVITSDTTYFASIESPASGCSSDLTEVNITVNGITEVGFAVEVVCEGETITFENLSVPDSLLSFTWDLGDGNTSNAETPTHLYDTAGTYNVKLIAEAQKGCIDSFEHEVTVKPSPIADFSVEDVCKGDSVIFVNASIQANDYEWKIEGVSVSEKENISWLFPEPGSYDVWLNTSSENGCADSVNRTVTVYNLPEAAFTADNTCEGDSVMFSNESSDASRYEWYYDNNLISESEHPSYLFNEAGDFEVMLVAFEGNCKDTFQHTTEIYKTPNAGFTIELFPDIAGVNLTPNNTALDSYNWDLGDGNSSTTVSPFHTYKEDGNYVITLNVSTTEGCTAESSDSVNITSVNLADRAENSFDFEAYPNPFSNEITITFSLPEPTIVSGRLFNIQGREMIVIVDEQEIPAGEHAINFDTKRSEIPVGTYFLRMNFNDVPIVVKLIRH